MTVRLACPPSRQRGGLQWMVTTESPFGCLNHFCFEILSDFRCSGENMKAYWQYRLHAQMIAFCFEITARSYQVAVIDFIKLQNMKQFLLFLRGFIRLLSQMIIKSQFYFALSHRRYYRLCGRAFFTAWFASFRFQNMDPKIWGRVQNSGVVSCAAVLHRSERHGNSV